MKIHVKGVMLAIVSRHCLLLTVWGRTYVHWRRVK